ncbi:MAG TPA: hypothetical protein EYM84_09245, partial [Flavobacteriales bacterium]|nr:hypothetical protein [Flavobacteriales bacterium]
MLRILFMLPLCFWLSMASPKGVSAGSSTNLGTAVNLDSLWGVWNDKSQPDTNRLKAMNKIAWDGYLYSQPDSAFHFAQLQH